MRHSGIDPNAPFEVAQVRDIGWLATDVSWPIIDIDWGPATVISGQTASTRGGGRHSFQQCNLQQFPLAPATEIQ